MDINQINTEERERLKILIKEETDSHNKECLKDDLEKLKVYPERYWNHFNVKIFNPRTILETQRLNTIIGMQNYYSSKVVIPK